MNWNINPSRKQFRFFIFPKPSPRWLNRSKQTFQGETLNKTTRLIPQENLTTVLGSLIPAPGAGISDLSTEGREPLLRSYIVPLLQRCGDGESG